MKLLVSTTETQGNRKNDFCFVPNGELLTYSVIECAGEKPDDECGCRRSMNGLDSGKATTTFRVIEQPITQEQFTKKVYQRMEKANWVLKMGEGNARDFAEVSTDELVRAIKKFPVGSILERRGDRFRLRK